MGDGVGDGVGAAVGDGVGVAVGDGIGDAVGDGVGDDEGMMLGDGVAADPPQAALTPLTSSSIDAATVARGLIVGLIGCSSPVLAEHRAHANAGLPRVLVPCQSRHSACVGVLRLRPGMAPTPQVKSGHIQGGHGAYLGTRQ